MPRGELVPREHPLVRESIGWLRDREQVGAGLINAIYDIHQRDLAYGYPFISDELADAEVTASERQVWRLCLQQRIRSVFAKKQGLRLKAGPPVRRFISISGN